MNNNLLVKSNSNSNIVHDIYSENYDIVNIQIKIYKTSNLITKMNLKEFIVEFGKNCFISENNELSNIIIEVHKRVLGIINAIYKNYGKNDDIIYLVQELDDLYRF
ncbi:MAG: hypothetical protein ACTSWR_01715 [Candidatus Helarchaeota archaeon]